MLLRTSKTGRGRGSHSHFVYLSADGLGQTSKAKDGHAHALVQGQMEPGPDGHIHELQDLSIQDVQQQKPDAEVLEDVLALWQEAKEYENDSRVNAADAEDCYKGKQWDEAAKRKLEAEDRASLTINEVESNIDLLSGYQRQNRSDIKFFPVEDGDSRVADILTELVKNIWEQNEAAFEESKVFLDEIVPGRGLFHIYEEYDTNIKGNVVIEKYPWREAWFGPHEKEDLSDCEYTIKGKWHSKAKMRQLWPDKAEEIDMDFSQYEQQESKKGVDEYTGVVEYDRQHGGPVNAPITNTYAGQHPSKEYIDLAKKQYLVLELERKTYYRVPILVEANGEVQNLLGMSRADIDVVKTIPQVSIVYRNRHKIRTTSVAGRVVLYDQVTEEEDFSLTPVYAKKIGNEWWGKVKGAIDPQKEINKRHSQFVDILNKVAAYGWFYDATTFPSEREKRKFQKTSAKPGFTCEVTDTSKIPVKVEGVKFPSEIVELAVLSSNKLRQIMNINLEMQGQPSNANSGIAIVERKRQGLIGNEFLFDNLNFAKKRIGRILVKKIQKLYDPERILRILENRHMKKAVQIAGESLLPDSPAPPQFQGDLEADMQAAQHHKIQMMAYQAEATQRRQDILTLLSESDLTKNDVVVGESSYNPTTRQANFMIWSEIAGRGFPVPPNLLVDLSDLPDKDKVKQAIEQMQAVQQQSDQAKQQTEITKTLIAKGGNQ